MKGSLAEILLAPISDRLLDAKVRSSGESKVDRTWISVPVIVFSTQFSSLDQLLLQISISKLSTSVTVNAVVNVGSLLVSNVYKKGTADSIIAAIVVYVPELTH